MTDELMGLYDGFGYADICGVIREKQKNMAENYVAIGFFLRKAKEKEMYKEGGYESIHQMAKEEFGMARQTADHCMRINERFSEDGYSPKLGENYGSYGKSQLQEMLYLTDEQLQDVTPDKTVREIREIRKPVEECSTSSSKNQDEDRILEEVCAEECSQHFPVEQQEPTLKDMLKKWVDNSSRKEKIFAAIREARKGGERPSKAIFKAVGNSYFGYAGFEEEFCSYQKGVCLNIGGHKTELTYGGFARELLTCFPKECSVTESDELKKTERPDEECSISSKNKCIHKKDMSCTLTMSQMETPGDGEKCNEKCCWECKKRGDCKFVCNAIDDEEELIEELSEYDVDDDEWGEKTDYELAKIELEDAEDWLKQYVECLGSESELTRRQVIRVKALEKYVEEMEKERNE